MPGFIRRILRRLAKRLARPETVVGIAMSAGKALSKHRDEPHTDEVPDNGEEK